MSSLPLHLVLLCAIACSQIFGGFSCCCLARSIAAGLYIAAEAALPKQQEQEQEQEQATSSQRTAPKCPRCATGRVSAASARVATANENEVNGLQPCSLSGGGECRCVKPSSLATLQHELRYQSIPVYFIPRPIVGLEAIPCEVQGEVRRHNLPLRFGGHSWQSMACIWKK